MVGITGSAGTGKSTVAALIREMGYLVIDCDEIVRRLYRQKETIDLIAKDFPEAVTYGNVNRKILGDIIFTDPERRKKLEKTVHPAIREKLLPFKNRKDVFVEVPLLYEAGFTDLFEVVICVACSKETEIKRLTERAGIDRKRATEMISAQEDIERKRKKATFTIENEGNTEELAEAVHQTIAKIRKQLFWD